MVPMDKAHRLILRNFLYKGKRKPDISLWVKIPASPVLHNVKRQLFETLNPASKEVAWRLFKKENNYIMEQGGAENQQQAVLNRSFSRGAIYISPSKNEGGWRPEAIIYGLLQNILINYLAHKQGIIAHSAGLKDTGRKGILFMGPTQSGKSTTARLWHDNAAGQLLNDDRVIIRKINKRFFIFPCPWHGEFSEYLNRPVSRAELHKVFFIYHSPANAVSRLNQKEAFKCLYPNVFLSFWNKEILEKQVSLCQDLLSRVASYRLGFKKDKSIISFVRSIG